MSSPLLSTQWTFRSEHETGYAALKLGALLRVGDFIGLQGPLGSGKTFFCKELAIALGVDPDEVTSPTFALIQEYKAKVPLYHLDLYRLETPEQVHELGIFDLFEQGIVVMEWFEKFAQLWPTDRLEIELSFLDDPEHRFCTATAYGTRAQELLKQWQKTF